MSRKTQTNFSEAFRVVLQRPWSSEPTYKGPYQTLSAAKGQLTQEIRYSSDSTGHVERMTGNWEKVEN